jgi:hypothetical protein
MADDVLFAELAKLLELITLESDDPDLLALALGRCFQPLDRPPNPELGLS